MVTGDQAATHTPTPSRAIALSKNQVFIVLVASGLGWMFDSVVINLYTVALPQLQREFSLTVQAIGGISSLFLLGYSLGSLAGGTMADYLGRRLSLGISILCYTGFAALTGLTGSVAMLSGARFLTGVGGGTELPVGSTYVVEVAPPRWRGLCVGLMNSLFSLGIFVASVLISVAGSWRWAFALTLPIGAVVWLIRLGAVESPHYKNVQTAITDNGMKRRNFTFIEVFRAEHIGTTIRQIVLWFGYWSCWWSFVIFMPRFLQMHGVEPSHVAWYMGAYGIAGMFGLILCGYLADVLGRRVTITLFCVLAIASIWIWTVAVGAILTPLIGGFLFTFLVAPGSAMLPYTAEAFPTTVRGTGQSVAIGASRLASVATPFAGGWLVASVGQSTEFWISSAFLLLTIAAAWSGRESAGVDLVDGIEAGTLVPGIAAGSGLALTR